MSRLCPPELLVACRAMRVDVSLRGPKISVRRDVSKGELVFASVLHYPLLGPGIGCFLGLDLLSGIVDFGNVTAVDGDEVHSVGGTHDCDVGWANSNMSRTTKTEGFL